MIILQLYVFFLQVNILLTQVQRKEKNLPTIILFLALQYFKIKAPYNAVHVYLKKLFGQ